MRDLVLGLFVGIGIAGAAGGYLVSQNALHQPPGIVSSATAQQRAPAASGPAINWNMASAFGSKLIQLGSLGKDLTEKLAKVSGNQIQLEFYEPNALVPPLEMFEAVAEGKLDAAWSTPGFWVGKDETFAMFSAVPFGPDSGEFVAWIYHGGGQRLMDEIYASHGSNPLSAGSLHLKPPDGSAKRLQVWKAFKDYAYAFSAWALK